MTKKLNGRTMPKFFAAGLAAVSLSTSAFAADLPTAQEIFKKMGLGINIGNTMEVPQNPTWWGNNFPTEAYIDTVKAAGFNTIRIPCAWYSHSNAMSTDSSSTEIVPGGSKNEIAESWMDSVKTVVDYCMRAGLVTILNIHWDSGWLENNLNDEQKQKVNERQKDFWTQIATKFKDYNENLLFASANEPATTDKNYAHETEILMGYHQTFVDAVRATGGNNASRTLIIQGPSTSIDRSVEVYPASKMPKDVIDGRLMFEVHYYDPSPYTIVSEPVDWGALVEPQYYWGEENYGTGDEIVHNCGYNPWGNGMGTPCSAADAMKAFKKMKDNYVDKGIPVIIGEYGANDRLDILEGEAYARHRKGRIGWYTAVARAAVENKVVPIAWDTGHEGSNHMTIIQRQSKEGVFDLEMLNALRKVYGMDDYVNTKIIHDETMVPDENLSKPPCDALGDPECGSTIDPNITAIGSIRPNSNPTLVHQGDKLMIQGNNAIKLFDANGNLVRSAQNYMNLKGLRGGMYIAKSGVQTLKIQVK